MEKQFVLKKSVLAVALTLAASPFAMAQQATSADSTVAKVVVTGSNLKRSDKEGPSPVQIITAKDIEYSGAGSVSDLLRQVPSMGSDVNRDLTSGSGFAKGVATASLRGLSSSSTLVLLNGRRMVYTAYADPNNGNSTIYDLNSIPLSAIERVEILKDGASAIYGSDAIGGVINFITKSSYDGAQVSGSYGANDNNLFQRKRATATWGHGDLDKDGYAFFITGEANKRERVAIKDAKDIQYQRYVDLNGRFRSNYSSSVSQYPEYFRESAPGSKNFGVTQANINTRVKWNLGCPANEQITGGIKDGLLATSVLIGQTFCNFDIDRFSEAQGASKSGSVLSRAEFRLNKDWNAYLEGSYMTSKNDYTGAPITISTTAVTNFTSTGVGPSFQAILPIGHPDNPWTDVRSSVNYRFTSLRGGSQATNEYMRGLAGIKGSAFGWDIDTAVLWNRNKNENISYGRLYLPTLNKLLTGTSLATLNADPTIGKNVVNHGTSDVVTFDLRGSTSFGSLPGGAMQAALGVEARKEKIKITPDSDVANGNIYGLANTVIDGKRSESSVFGEIQLPLFKGFEIDMAGRYDKYEGLDGNFVPKIGSKWAVNDMISLRGGFQRGFRAPALQQVTPGGAQFFQSGVWDPKRCNDDNVTPKNGATAADCSKSIAGTGGANPNLVPEKSKSMTFGLIIQPLSNFDATFDFFKIRKEGEVVLGTSSDALKNEDRVPGNVLRDTNPVNFIIGADGKPIPGTGPLLMVKLPWTNQGAMETRGVDMSFKLRNNLGKWGKLNSSIDATYIQKFVIAQLPGDPENNVAGGRSNIWDWLLSRGIDNPRWRSGLSTSWNYDVHTVNASVNYVGPVSLLRVVDGNTTYAQPFCYYGTKKATDAAPDRSTAVPLFENFTPDCNIPSWTTFGLGYTYSGVKNLQLSLNIQNIFDTKAPYDPNATGGGYTSGLHNNWGRYFRVGATYNFK